MDNNIDIITYTENIELISPIMFIGLLLMVLVLCAVSLSNKYKGNDEYK
jgi:hypothetical protein